MGVSSRGLLPTALLLTLTGCTLNTEGSAEDVPFGDADGVDSTMSVDSSAAIDTDTTADSGTMAGDGTTPDTSAPDSLAPDTLVLDTFVPDTFAPDTFKPDTFVPDTFKPDTGAPCPEAAGMTFGGHCYFTLTARTQGAAKTDCAAVGAHLVTVTSDAEHEFLKTVGSGDRWIGLQSATPSNDRATYQWVTGETKTVSHWYSADPDGMGPCVAMHGTLQEWVDRGCAGPHAAICERE